MSLAFISTASVQSKLVMDMQKSDEQAKGRSSQVQLPASESSQLPIWLKLTYTAFLAVMVPVYWVNYTPLNFLWFCDIALALCFVAIWTEKPFPASMAAVGILFPQIVWLLDFFYRAATGGHIIDLTEYMFDSDASLFLRGLSFFHGWLPLLLIYLVYKLGYDRRALLAQTGLAWLVLIASYLLTSDPNGPADNVNKVFPPSEPAWIASLPQFAWVGILMLLHPVLSFLPTHFVLRRFCHDATPGNACSD